MDLTKSQAVALIALVAALLTVTACEVGHPQGSSSGNGSSSNASDLIGVWRPIRVLGRDVTALGKSPVTRADVSFSSNGRWGAFDGCATYSGSYRVPAPGRLVTAELATTIALCSPTAANNTAISLARRYSIRSGVLTFMRSNGSVTGTYMRETEK